MLKPLFHRTIAALFAAACAWLAAAADGSKGPRGKPINSPVTPRSGVVATQNVVRLPGGVLLTNIPGEFLPANTNSVRLPAAAARKFEPFGYLPTSFTVLSRFFPDPKPAPNASEKEKCEELRKQIPEDVLSMNGKKIALVGFTLPITLANQRATEFLLLRTQSACCFGMVPRVNEWITVKMPAGMKPELDVPVIVGGVLRIKWIGDGNELAGLYEMEADRVEAVR